MSKKLTTDEFVKKARLVHGNRYDYSVTEYSNAHKKVNIKCLKHGVFQQSPYSHAQGYGCSLCAFDLRRSTRDQFVKRAKEVHGNKYDYSEVVYKSARHKVGIRCLTHGVFEQIPSQHLRGKGCQICMSQRLTKDEFIKRSKQIHGKKYDYSQVAYLNAHEEVDIGCPQHGFFKQSPNSHMRGFGCRKCGGLKSENNVEQKLIASFPKYRLMRHFRVYSTVHKRRRYFDFVICRSGGEHVVVEYDGEQHFRPVRFGGISKQRALDNLQKQKEIDRMDIELCHGLGWTLFRIKCTDDIDKKCKELERIICQ